MQTVIPAIAALTVLALGAMAHGFWWSHQRRLRQDRQVSADCVARIERRQGRKGEGL